MHALHFLCLSPLLRRESKTLSDSEETLREQDTKRRDIKREKSLLQDSHQKRIMIDSENSWISGGLPSSRLGRRRMRGEGSGGWREGERDTGDAIEEVNPPVSTKVIKLKSYASGRMDFARWKFKPKSASSNLKLSCRRLSVGLTVITSTSKIIWRFRNSDLCFSHFV